MALRPLHLLSSPVLRERAQEVEDIDAEIRTLVDDLYDTMYAAEGIGLAANQIGIAKRVAVVDIGEGNRILLLNPVIVSKDGKEKAEEGCLSIPDIFGEVERAVNIVLETMDLDGKRHTLNLSDLEARAVQHEIDHLDGILFLDHLSPLRRRMLLKKWKKSRKGETGYLKEVTPAGAS
ncbi:MAG: peptide deformylase [Gemmatimonadota bacterium]|nr:peptide deformylase [Gemmatimonadota bacterium]MDH5804191.1 peptide deformylase [Gemmatimonadota bacterium]